jgi:hypothetical protein
MADTGFIRRKCSIQSKPCVDASFSSAQPDPSWSNADLIYTNVDRVGHELCETYHGNPAAAADYCHDLYDGSNSCDDHTADRIRGKDPNANETLWSTGGDDTINTQGGISRPTTQSLHAQ